MALSAVGFLGACGGNVNVGSGGNGNGGAGGGGEGGGTSSISTSAGGTSSVSVGGGQSSSSSSMGGGPSSCDGLQQIACLGAYPSCVPVYDDECCPICDPTGGCADCINIQFHHCAPLNSECAGKPPSCGQVPEWACSGGAAACANVDPGGSKTPCATVAGCIPAYCPTNKDCTTDPVCHAATKDACITQCDAVPPPCPAGTYAESDGFCYTGYCIPENLCVIGL
jgi:hypothetical protein